MPAKTAKKPAVIPTSLGGLRDKMEKKYGTGAVTRRETIKPYECIPTGSMSLDLALRVGGWVRGRMHEVVGPPGVGKTTLVANSMAQAQKKYPDEAVAVIDMEQSFDFQWAQKQGLDISDERFLHVYPENSEDVSDQLREMIETGLFSLICVDSIGGMESKQAFERDAEENVVGRNAQVITRMVKRLAVLARKHNVAVLLINQPRVQIGTSGSGQPLPDESAGPRAAKHSTTTKVEMRRAGGSEPLRFDFKDGEGSVIVGVEIAAKVTRNKVAAALKTGKFWLINQETPDWGPVGIDQAQEAYTIGEFAEVFEIQPGSYYWMPWTTDRKERLHGKTKVLEFLRANPDKAAELRDAALEKMAADVIPQHLIDFDLDGQEILVDTATGVVE